MDDQQSAARAISIERLAPEINVVTPDPGEPGDIELHLQCGRLSPDLFMFSKQAPLTADMAIALGEHLAAEGRKRKTGLIIPGTEIPKDL